MAKRIFISFPAEDSWARDYLVGQARNERSPFEFVDMSVKEPWSESWKTQCRTKIRGCNGMIAMVTKNTLSATGQLWEVNCAKAESVKIIGIYASSQEKPAKLPVELSGVQVLNWTWENVKNFIDNT